MKFIGTSSETSSKHIMSFLWPSYERLTNFFKNTLQIFYKLPMNFSYTILSASNRILITSLQTPKNFLKFSHKLLANFLITSCKLLMKFLT